MTHSQKQYCTHFTSRIGVYHRNRTVGSRRLITLRIRFTLTLPILPLLLLVLWLIVLGSTLSGYMLCHGSCRDDQRESEKEHEVAHVAIE
jgi:hypothetical protein